MVTEDQIKKCIISRYDKTIKEPINMNDGGVEFLERLKGACRSKGYIFKFYTTSSEKDKDYEIVVE